MSANIDCRSHVICTGNPIPAILNSLAPALVTPIFFLPLPILLNIPYSKRTWTGAPDVYTFFCQERIEKLTYTEGLYGARR